MDPESVQETLRWFRRLWHEADRLAVSVKPETADRTDRAADVRREVEHLVLHCGSGLSTEARRWIIDLIDAVERDWRRHVTQTGPAPAPPPVLAAVPSEVEGQAQHPTRPTPRVRRTQRPSWAVRRLRDRLLRPAN